MTKEHTPEEMKYRLSNLGVQIGNIAINYITELEKACDETQELLDKQIEATYKLDKENAGLKAGRPQWHFVSKEGFPSKDDIYLIIRNDGLHLGDYCCGGDGDIDCQSWCDYPSEEEIQDDSVIAWCEIPTFTDKE